MTDGVKEIVFSYHIKFIKEDSETKKPTIIIELKNNDEIFDKAMINYDSIANDVTTYKKSYDHVYHTELVSYSHEFGLAPGLMTVFRDSIYFVIKNNTITAECICEVERFVKDRVMPWLNLKEEV